MAAISTPSIRRLPKTYDAIYYPFFLDGVAADPKLNQARRHASERQGVDVIVARIMPKVEELIARVKAARGS